MKKGWETKGFTLAELLAVVAIIAILVAVAIPVFSASMERSQQNVCLNNRTALAHELIYLRMTDGTLNQMSDAALQLYLTPIANASGITCPLAEGQYSVTVTGPESNELTVNCSIHSQTIPQKTAEEYQKMIESFQDYTDLHYLNNDDLRRKYYALNGGAWSILRVGGTDYYIQPYFNISDPEQKAWIYAGPGTEPDAADKWKAYYIYEPNERRWYQCYGSNGKPNNTWISRYDTTDQIVGFIHGTYENGQPMCKPLDGPFQELLPPSK